MKSSVDIDRLFSERFNTYYREASSYWRLIGNSGLLFTVTVLFILGATYYEQFIQWIPHWFPVALVLALLFAALCSFGDHRMFLKEADLIFLTPLETEMEKYFSKAYLYNYFIQGLGVFFFLLILSPLYAVRVDTVHLLLYFLIPILLKGWNLYSSWIMLQCPNRLRRTIHKLLRFLFSFLLLYWIYSGGLWPGLSVFAGVIFAAGFILFYVYDKRVKGNSTYRWLQLYEMDRKLSNRFYSFVHAFVDVPHLSQQIKKRGWVPDIGKLIPFRANKSQHYLYFKTFIRANDYFGRFIRLTVIGLLMFAWFPELWAKALVLISIVWLTGVQLRGLKAHHERQFWHQIFPLPQEQFDRAYRSIRYQILIVQSLLMILIGSLF